MTAITKADIPADIVTLEQLAAWCALNLAAINPAVTVVEGSGIVERACQANLYYIAPADKNRLLVRLSIEFSPEYLLGGGKLWKYALPVSDTPLPAAIS